MIVFTQIRIVTKNYICHPTLSSASVPTLVGAVATHCIGSRCIVLVTNRFVAAGCACVILAASMAMLPTVVLGGRIVGGPRGPRRSWRHHWRAG